MESGNRMKNWFHEHKLKFKVICGMNNNAMQRQKKKHLLFSQQKLKQIHHNSI
jgi:hypothetical protein